MNRKKVILLPVFICLCIIIALPYSIVADIENEGLNHGAYQVLGDIVVKHGFVSSEFMGTFEYESDREGLIYYESRDFTGDGEKELYVIYGSSKDRLEEEIWSVSQSSPKLLHSSWADNQSGPYENTTVLTEEDGKSFIVKYTGNTARFRDRYYTIYEFIGEELKEKGHVLIESFFGSDEELEIWGATEEKGYSIVKGSGSNLYGTLVEIEMDGKKNRLDLSNVNYGMEEELAQLPEVQEVFKQYGITKERVPSDYTITSSKGFSSIGPDPNYDRFIEGLPNAISNMHGLENIYEDKKLEEKNEWVNFLTRFDKTYMITDNFVAKENYKEALVFSSVLTFSGDSNDIVRINGEDRFQIPRNLVDLKMKELFEIEILESFESQEVYYHGEYCYLSLGNTGEVLETNQPIGVYSIGENLYYVPFERLHGSGNVDFNQLETARETWSNPNSAETMGLGYAIVRGDGSQSRILEYSRSGLGDIVELSNKYGFDKSESGIFKKLLPFVMMIFTGAPVLIIGIIRYRGK